MQEPLQAGTQNHQEHRASGHAEPHPHAGPRPAPGLTWLRFERKVWRDSGLLINLWLRLRLMFDRVQLGL